VAPNNIQLIGTPERLKVSRDHTIIAAFSPFGRRVIFLCYVREGGSVVRGAPSEREHMMQRSRFQGRLGQRLALPAAVIAIILTGCQSSKADPTASSQILTASTQALGAGDLELARQYLDQARAATVTPAQQVKIDSLDWLIDGTEALRAGDPDGARTAWSQIQEPNLSREVRHKARLIGLDVPMGASGGLKQ